MKLSALSQLVHLTSAALWIIDWGSLDFTLGDVVDWLSAGNPGIVVGKIVAGKNSPWSSVLDPTLPTRLLEYAVFHSALTILFVIWAAVRLRSVFLKQASRRIRHSRAGGWLRQRRVGTWPMIWKEVNCEGRSRSPWIAWIIVVVLLGAVFVPAVLIVTSFWTSAYEFPINRWDNFTILATPIH